ncbi:MAG: hypothetical protein QMD82_06740 [bacterium]|nr:hypothetical protein [bacterium]
MKKFLLVCLVCAVPLGAQVSNLLLNPDFESWDTSSVGQDSMPRFWHLSVRGTQGGVSANIKKVEGFEGFGAKLAVVGDTSGYDASFYHIVYGIDTLPFADDTFLLSIMVKENSPNISGRFYCYWQDSIGNIVGSAVSSSYTTDSLDWQEVSLKTTRPDSTAVRFKFDLRIYKYSTVEDSIIVDKAYFGPLVVSVSERTSLDIKIPSTAVSTLPIEFSAIKPTKVDLFLYGVDGRKLSTLYSGLVSGVLRKEFSLGYLKPGVYFVVADAEGTRKQYRVIKF